MLNKLLHLVFETCLLASGSIYLLQNCIPKNIFLSKKPNAVKGALLIEGHLLDIIQ